jgi:hypothetical protein
MTARITGIPEMRAAVVLLRSIDKDLRADINKQNRAVVVPIWKQAVESRAVTPVQKAVIAKGTRVNVGMKPTLIAASSRKPLSGGLVPTDQWKPVEFGSRKRGTTTYTSRSPKGKSFQVTRRTHNQFPWFRPKGSVAFPAKDEVAPRLFSLWAQTAVRLIYEAFKEGR